MNSGEPWRLGKRPALDGLRGVAILLVVAAHTLLTFTGHHLAAAWGPAGVTVFFTLSGFLITSLLLEGQHLNRFYRNRALRLFPAIAALVLIAGTLQIRVGVGDGWSSVAVLGYFANWFQIGGGDLGWFTHTWSLAVEEQFYLVWPLVLLAVRRWRNGPLVLCVVGLVVSTVLRFVLWDGGAGVSRVYGGSDVEAGALLTGCLLAIGAHRGLPPVKTRWTVPIGGAVLLALGAGNAPWITYLLVMTVVPVVAVTMIWGSLDRDGFLSARWLRYVGARSYGLYIWHPFGLLIAKLTLGVTFLGAVVGLSIAFATAEVSWRFVETPFLRLKDRSARSDSGHGERAGRAVVAG